MNDAQEQHDDDASPDPIESLVLECIDAFEREGPAALSAIYARSPEHAAVVRSRVESLRRMGLLTLVDSGVREAIPERLGEFELIERIGGGGMGVVYLAEQTSLGRRVALKLVRPEQLYFGGARERFQREAQAVARLSHPSIVPIHAVGEENGIPYFAMEYVRGATLADVLVELRAAAPEKLTGADLRRAVLAHVTTTSESGALPRIFARGWTEACLETARQVALALEHAHQRGVTHRDVKPSNVMITADGRVLLIDFGLASRQDAAKLTRTGAQVGSLQYMAPEQIEGDATNIGPRTDVYGLGVTLYEILTLRPPFASESSTSLSLAILQAEPPRMRAINPSLAIDVETVCFKALDGVPAARYASAEAFARDLANVLEHRPIEARRASVALRASRWIQRHPATAAAIALSVVLFVGGPLLFAIQQKSARERIERANEETLHANTQLKKTLAIVDAERERARANFDSAADALNLLTEVGERRLASVPQAEVARREILEAALAFQQKLGAQRGDDPAVLLETARARLRVGKIQVLLGRGDESIDALRASFDDFESWKRATNAAFLPLDAARAANALGEQYSTLSKPADAREWLARALEIASTKDRPDAASRETRYLQYEILFDMASALRLAGDTQHAVERLGVCRSILVPLVREEPTNPSFAVSLSETITAALSWAHPEMMASAPPESAAPNLDTELRDLRQALDVLEKIHAQDPAGSSVALAYAWTRANLGFALALALQLPAAETELSHATVDLEELVRAFPSTLSHREKFIMVLSRLGGLQLQMQHAPEARALMERALAEQERLAVLNPDLPRLLLNLGSARLNLAVLVRDLGDLEAVCKLAEGAHSALEQHLAKNPRDPYAVPALEYSAMVAGEAYSARGLHREAARWLRTMKTGAVPSDMEYTAQVFGKCAALALADASLSDSDRVKLHDEYVDSALASLRSAVAQGYKDAKELESAKSLDFLRENAQFKQIVEQLKSP